MTPLVRTKTVALYDAFDSHGIGNRWVPSGGTTADDTTYVWHPAAGPTWKSCKLTKSSGSSSAYMRWTLGSATNLSGKHGFLYFYIHEGSGASAWTTITSMEVRLRLQSDVAKGWRYQIHERTGNLQPPRGWRTAFFCPRSYKSKFSGTETEPDWSAIGYIEVYFTTTNTTDTPSVTFDGIEFVDQPERALLVSWIDDGTTAGLEDYADPMLAVGIKPTLAIIPNSVGTSGYAGWDTLREYRDKGCYVANHSWSHPAPWMGLTATERRWQVGWAADKMTREGLGEGARVFVLPGGTYHASGVTWTQGSFEEIADLVEAVRMTSPWISSPTLQPVHREASPYLCTAWGKGGGGGYLSGKTPAEHLTAAVLDHAALPMYMHDVNGSLQDMTGAERDALIAAAVGYMREAQLDTAHVGQLLARQDDVIDRRWMTLPTSGGGTWVGE